jgi:hypothetical protein
LDGDVAAGGCGTAADLVVVVVVVFTLDLLLEILWVCSGTGSGAVVGVMDDDNCRAAPDEEEASDNIRRLVGDTEFDFVDEDILLLTPKKTTTTTTLMMMMMMIPIGSE